MTLETAPEPTGVKQFRYDAFISYRHVDPDRVWAKWLHSALEGYRVPRALVRGKGLPPRIGRVFRDEEELPASEDLNGEIESALSQSRFLIVICSPRATQSRWVNREIERFREMGRPGHILALLVEGEPGAAFPRALREIRHTVVDRGGSSHERIEEVEPLAADVREARQESSRYLRRMAKLRILSCVLGVKFDDLRRREQERRARRMAYLGTVLAVLLLVVGGLAVYAFRQRDAAVRERGIAEAQRRRAEVELASGTVLQGDLLGSAGRWIEARDKYRGAETLFRQNDADPRPAELGLWDASGHVSGPLSTLAGHSGSVVAVAISPDGRRALSGGADSVLRLWDLPTGKAIATFPGHAGTVRAIIFLPDGSRALSAGDDKSIKLWDVTSGREMHTFSGHSAAVNALVVSPHGGQFLSGDAAGKVNVWNIADGALASGIDTKSPLACLAVSSDASRLLCGGSDGITRLFDMPGGALLRAFGSRGLPVTTVAFLPDGKTVFSCGFDNEFQIWALEGDGPHDDPKAAAKPVRSFKNPASRVSSAVLSPSRRTLLAGNWDGPLETFDFETGQVRRMFVGHMAAMVSQVAVGPDGRIAVSASTDMSLKVWDAGIPTARHSWTYGAVVSGAGFSGDGRTAFTALSSGRLELWDIASEQTLYTERLPGSLFLTAALCPDGRSAVAAGISADGTNALALCDLTGVKPVVWMKGHQGMILGLAVSPDGKTALTGADDKTARVWDLAAGRELHSLPHSARVSLVALSPDGRLALTGNVAGMRLWDAVGWTELRAVGAPPTSMADACCAAAFSPDSRSILAGTYTGALKVFDAGTGHESRAFLGAHTRAVGRIAFSPDGQLAASGSDDHTLRLWDVASGRELRVLSGHDESVREITFSPDGQSLLTGGLDRKLNLWNFASAKADAQGMEAVDAARDAAAKAPSDAAAAAALMKSLGQEYARRGLDDWAVTVLEQARTGGAAVSPLLLGRCYWRMGRMQLAHAELQKALVQKEAPPEYLSTCLKRIDTPETAAPVTVPATRPAP